MKICITDRRTGKTTALIDWMLQGGPIEHPPYWSRVIVVNTRLEVVRVREMVAQRGGATEAVWSTEDLRDYNSRHYYSLIEYAIDDLQMLLPSFVSGAAFATMTATPITLEEVRNHEPRNG